MNEEELAQRTETAGIIIVKAIELLTSGASVYDLELAFSIMSAGIDVSAETEEEKQKLAAIREYGKKYGTEIFKKVKRNDN